MISVTYTSARNQLAKVLVEAQQNPVAITRRGYEAVYVVSKADFEQLVKAKAKAHIQHKHRSTIDSLADR